MPPPDHPDDEAKDDPWGDDQPHAADETPLETPGPPGIPTPGLGVDGPLGELDEPLEHWEDGDDDRRDGIAGDEELDADELDLVDEIPEERTVGGESPAGLDDERDDEDDAVFEDGPGPHAKGDANVELDEALGIDFVDENGFGQDRGEEGTGEETELDESSLPPLDADDEGDELPLLDPAFERSMLGSMGDDRWELVELAPGRFRCVAQDEELVVAGGDALFVRAADWAVAEARACVSPCSPAPCRAHASRYRRPRACSSRARARCRASGSRSLSSRSTASIGAEQLVFARERVCFVDRHGSLFELGESGQLRARRARGRGARVDGGRHRDGAT
jgi:hypothetical protein